MTLNKYCNVCKEFQPKFVVHVHEYLDNQIKFYERTIRQLYNKNGKPLEVWQRSLINHWHDNIDIYKDMLNEFEY